MRVREQKYSDENSKRSSSDWRGSSTTPAAHTLAASTIGSQTCRPAQMIAEVARYIGLDASNYPFSKNSHYQESFQSFLWLIRYDRLGRLKRLLRSCKVKEEYPSKFLEFSASFIGTMSLKMWILYKIL